MGKYLTVLVVSTLVSLLPVTQSLAHHSFGMFDTKPESEIYKEGVVKRWRFSNPHTWLYVTVANEDGSNTDWAFEGSAIPTLIRWGINKDTFKEGDRVTIIAAPMKDGRSAGGLKAVVLENGEIVTANDPAIAGRGAIERWHARNKK